MNVSRRSQRDHKLNALACIPVAAASNQGFLQVAHRITVRYFQLRYFQKIRPKKEFLGPSGTSGLTSTLR
jgi:hypothetical protein